MTFCKAFLLNAFEYADIIAPLQPNVNTNVCKIQIIDKMLRNNSEIIPGNPKTTEKRNVSRLKPILKSDKKPKNHKAVKVSPEKIADLIKPPKA